MSNWSPTAEGFRTMFRRPALSLAEVSWRWSFGAAACILLSLGFLAYLDTLPVDSTDLLLLRTRQPVLIAKAFSHILHGSALRVALASIVLFSALTVLWILLASVGRGATLACLLDYIRERALHFANTAGISASPKTSELVSADTSYNWPLRSLAGLHFLRSALALAAGAAAVGAMIVCGFVSTSSNPHPGLAFFFAAAAILFLWLIWSSISWFLSTASIFVVRQGKNTFAALSSTVDLCRERFGPVIAVGTWFGLAHLVLFVIATSVVAFPFAFVPVVPLGVVLIAVFFLTIVYFAFVDTLYIGRLAGYVAILEAPPIPAPAPILPPERSSQHSAVRIQPETAMVDQGELILSDIPNPVHVHPSQPQAVQSETSSSNEGSMRERGPSKATQDSEPDPP
jgi:hypothetical protein